MLPVWHGPLLSGRSVLLRVNRAPQVAALSFHADALGFWVGRGFSRADRSKLRPALAAGAELLAVQNRWKSCGHNELTGEQRDDSFTRFRGQSNSHSCEFAWTEGAPLRRKAIRSLTTRLNVPVVREKFGHKSERNSQDSLRAYGYGATSAFYPSADIRFQTRV